MVKYGLSRVDSSGKIVSIWNFAELDEHLAKLVSPVDSEKSGEKVGGHTTSDDGCISEEVSCIAPRALAANPSEERRTTCTENEGLLPVPVQSERDFDFVLRYRAHVEGHTETVHRCSGPTGCVYLNGVKYKDVADCPFVSHRDLEN